MQRGYFGSPQTNQIPFEESWETQESERRGMTQGCHVHSASEGMLAGLEA